MSTPSLCSPISTKTHGEILYVDFIDGKPHSVLTTTSSFDFDWCKRDEELLFYDSGSGIRPDATQEIANWCSNEGKSFWAADSLRLRIRKDWNHDTRAYDIDEEATPEALARHGLVRLASIDDPFEDATEAYYGIDYCSICEDHFDHDNKCDHIWSGVCGEMVGPGSDDGIDHMKECFLRFCAITGITRRLRSGLVPFDIRIRISGSLLGPSSFDLYVGKKHIGDIARRLHAEDDDLSDAASLLYSLDDRTVNANALIKAWLETAVFVQESRRASNELVYIVTDDYDYAANKRYDGERRTYLDDTNGVGTVFATAKQVRATRMSWAEASALVKRLNGGRFRRWFFVRHLRKRGGAL